MEEGHYVDLCENLHGLADEMGSLIEEKGGEGQYTDDWASLVARLRELAGIDTREGK